MKTLVVIPARGGSKSVPDKNIRLLAGRPLIWYTLDCARMIAEDGDICVSTDSKIIAGKVNEYGLDVPFFRPAELATDTAGQYDVIKHAYMHFLERGVSYDRIVLLQPTSPFRRAMDITGAMDLFSTDIDMVVSVCKTDANPYFVLYEENIDGFLVKSKEGNFVRRQDCPPVWQLNGSVYVINPAVFSEYDSFSRFKKIVRFEMSSLMSVDIDNETDWEFCEFLATRHKIVL
ncbi:MAG: acylneuraminate cytidylyltransferase family protein [Bacteroidia bacterium]|nr:MAG: acylneuraminate cytidylyltransferase family protein [Bacteroidia bacterium]